MRGKRVRKKQGDKKENIHSDGNERGRKKEFKRKKREVGIIIEMKSREEF